MKALKKILPRGLFGRSLLIIVLPLVLLQVVMVIVFYERHWDTVSRRLSLGVAGDLAAAITILHSEIHPSVRESLLADFSRNTSLSLDFERGGILPNVPPRTTDRILDRMLIQALGERLVQPFQIDTRSFDEDIEIRIQLADGVLTAYTPRKRISSTTTHIFLIWMTGSSLILVAIAVVFLRNQMKPILRLAKAADAFGKGRETVRVKPEGAIEIRQAATAFIDMQERIQRQIQQRTEMLSGVSHDLRTPLTRMKLQLAMMPRGEERQQLENDISQMEKMIAEYLAFARGEGGEAAQQTRLDLILHEVADDARRHGAVITCETTGDMSLDMRPNAMRRALSNLTENAARFGNTVAISARRFENFIEIIIDDDGPGIAQDEREYVFKPFVRLDHSRNPETGGAGLGLSISRDIVHRHGGEIDLADSPLGGLRVLLRLPI